MLREGNDMLQRPYWQIKGRLVEDRIAFEPSLAAVRDHLEAGRVIVVTDIWPEEQVISLRHAARDWAERHAPYPAGQSASLPGLSFHRFDDEKTQSLMPHVFHQIGLAADSHDDPRLWAMATDLVMPLLDLQNRLAGMHVDLRDPMVRIKIMNHPVGGGFLVKHIHPREHLGVAFFLSLSRPGVDYRTGDVVFDINGEEMDAGACFAPGNAIFFRYDLPHAITPIDPHQRRDWSAKAGLWLMSVEPIGAYLQSQST
jgi:hypothetical protein